MNGQRDLTGAYTAIFIVVAVWGISPVFNYYIYEYISPSVCTALTGLTAATALLLLSIRRLHLLNRSLVRLAIITGIFNSAASLLQKIGLPYTTPSSYAFLENLSCVTVPVLMFVLVRQRPGVIRILSSLICIIGCFILSGIDLTSGDVSFGIGELLCALAGIFYGVNIAGTGAFSGKMYAPLYIFVQMCVHTVISTGVAIALNFITVNGSPLETARFCPDVWPVLAVIAMGLITNVICWVMRTNAMKKINATTVAVIMPLSAVVTGLVSVAMGIESLTPSLAVGGSICVVAAIMSSLPEKQKRKAAPVDK